MATRQNESTMKFKADIAELKSSMQQAKTSIAQAKAEFDKSTEGLDNWRKSSEGVEAKLKQLRSTLQSQSAVLDNYREQLARTEEQFGANSVQSEQLREKIEKQKSTISKTKNDINKFEGSLRELAEAESVAEREGISVDDALRKIRKSADDAGDAVEDASGGFTVMKGALASLVADGIKSFIGGVMNAIAETKEFRNELAMLEATANTTGTGFEKAQEKLKEIATITDDTGAGVEAVNNMMSAGFKGDNLDKLTEQLLGASIKWKDTLKMEGLADGLQETLATGSAVGPFSELLERGGQNLDDFNAGLANCKTEAEKQNFVLQELNKLGLKPVLDEYKEQNKYMMMNSEASYSLQESMSQMATKVEPVIATVKQGLADMFSTLLNMGDGINFEGIAEKISSGFAIVKQVMTGQMSIGELMTMGSDWLKNIGEGLVQGIPNLISKGLNMLVNFTGSLRANAPKLIQSGLEFIHNMIKGLMNALPDLIAKVPTIVSNIAGVINDNGPTILKSAVGIILTIIKGIISAIPTLVANIPKIIRAIVDVWSAFNWMNLGKNAIKGLGNGIKSLGGWIKGVGTNVKDWIVNAIKNLPSNLMKLGKSAIQNFGSAISSAKSFATTAIKKIFNAVVDGVKKLPEKMLSIGKDLVKGLWNGISDMTGWVISKIEGFGESVLGGIKDFFGIHSPSRVMEKEVGLPIVQGIVKGIKENIALVSKSVTSVTDDVYQKAVQAQQTYLMNVRSMMTELDLFSAFSVDEVAGGTLIDNLNSQVDALTRYQNAIDSLRARGVSSTLMTELESKGVSALAQIEALAKMNEAELANYQMLYDQKVELAKEANETAFVNQLAELGIKIDENMSEIIVKSKESGEKLTIELSNAVSKTTKTNQFKSGVQTIRTVIKSVLDQVDSDVASTLGNVLSAVTQMKSALASASSGSDSVGGALSTVTNVTYNFNQTNNSPQPLTRTEIYRQSKNLLNSAVGV